jgi:hypothetical protein
LSLLSSPALVAAVTVRCTSVITSLALLSSLDFAIIEPIIKLDREVNYFVELFRSVYSYEFVLHVVLESSLEYLYIGVFIEVKMRNDLLEFSSVYAS